MEIYKNQEYTFEERAADLVSRMTLEEKIYQIGNHGAAIPRLGIPYYNYWSEASHGCFGPFRFRDMEFTCYPVCLGMSQSWDRNLLRKVTTAISDEARAYHNEYGDELHYWCPTLNLARDPRNGRSDENFGEDPFLAGKLAVSYIQGMQGDDEKYAKTIATPKHFMMNSSENNRHWGSSNVDMATLREYYGKVFEYAVREGKAKSIMTSYNRINGVPASCNEFMLTTLLREEWGFDGFVVSDAGAVADTYANPMFITGSGLAHYYCEDELEASAMTLKAGTDITCGKEHRKYLKQAVEKGLVDENDIDRAAIRTFISRFSLGLFDRPEDNPYHTISLKDVCNEEKASLSVEMANDSIVLLKNDVGLLPVQTEKVKSILVVGPNAKFRQLGGYSVGAENPLVDTPVNIMAYEGIKKAAEEYGIEVFYEKGWCSDKEYKTGGMHEALPGVDPEDLFTQDYMPDNITMEQGSKMFTTPDKHAIEDPDYQADSEVLFKRALDKAKEVDLVVFAAGTDDVTASEEHDRETLELPYGQNEKIKRMLEVNSNTAVVLITLGTVTGDALDQAHTLLNAHFAGEAQGSAIANILFGKVNPNAKLTTTWYKNLDELPHVNEYGLKKQDTYDKKSRTYMYFDGEVRFPFGYGLSYTAFRYDNMRVKAADLDANDLLEVTVDVTNIGDRDGKEIVELYISKMNPPELGWNKPKRQLKGFEKIMLKSGETRKVAFQVPLSDVTFWSNFKEKMVVEEGEYLVEIGKDSENIQCKESIQIHGEWKPSLSGIYCTADKYIYRIGDEGKIKVSATLEDCTHLKAGEYQVSYESSREDTADVSPEGTIIARGCGVTTITVKVQYGTETMQKTLAIAVKDQ